MSEIYSVFRIWTSRIVKTGKLEYLVEFKTNDDNDDGYPDGEEVRAVYHCKSLNQALGVTGKSRIGLYGQPVDVYLDDKKIGLDDMPELEEVK